VKRCVTSGCDRPIPHGVFCRRCLSALDDQTRHVVLFGKNGDRDAAISRAKAKLGGSKDARVARLYRLALEADAVFSEELARVYGPRASEERYRYGHTDPKLLAAIEEFQRATDALLAEMRNSL
jgi:hypothetical protein